MSNAYKTETICFCSMPIYTVKTNHLTYTVEFKISS